MLVIPQCCVGNVVSACRQVNRRFDSINKLSSQQGFTVVSHLWWCSNLGGHWGGGDQYGAALGEDAGRHPSQNRYNPTEETYRNLQSSGMKFSTENLDDKVFKKDLWESPWC